MDKEAYSHAYSVTFADDGAYEISVDLNHLRNDTLLPYEVFTSWSVEEDTRIANIQFNTSLAWGDEIDLNIDVIGWNGDSLDEAVSASRSLTVGTWNQPMADHEVMTSTTWDLKSNIHGTKMEPKHLFFPSRGQGWQERVGLALNSWGIGQRKPHLIRNEQLKAKQCSTWF